MDCFSHTLKTSGIRGVYQGLGVSMSSIFLYRGMFFGFYDTGKNLIPNFKEMNFW